MNRLTVYVVQIMSIEQLKNVFTDRYQSKLKLRLITKVATNQSSHNVKAADINSLRTSSNAQSLTQSIRHLRYAHYSVNSV